MQKKVKFCNRDHGNELRKSASSSRHNEAQTSLVLVLVLVLILASRPPFRAYPPRYLSIAITPNRMIATSNQIVEYSMLGVPKGTVRESLLSTFPPVPYVSSGL